MISFDTPLALILAVPLCGLAFLFWRNGFVNLSRRRARIALAVRVALLTAIVLGLAGMGFTLPQSREAVAVVADLSASDAQSASEMQAFINQVARQRPADGQAGVVVAGRDARVDQPVSSLAAFDGFQTPVDANYTNLEDGILLANAILPGGYRHRITVMTDGQENVGDAINAARLVHSLGVRVDVWPARVAHGPEVLVDSLTMPSQLRPRETFSIDVAVRSTVNTDMQLALYRDRRLVLSTREAVRAGANDYVFSQPPLPTGNHSYQVRITPTLDTQAENNSGSAFTVVAGPPRVLVISPSRSEATTVLNSLTTTGIHADFRYPSAVIPTLTYLQAYAGVVLIDTPVDALDPQLVADLVPYVRDIGRGLLVIGGRETYGMGGYGQTALETVLPVSMDLPKRKDLPSAAVVLIIESLESDAQVNISKQAGKGVIGLLTQQDQIAVSDASGQFAVPLQHAVNKLAIDNAIDRMQPNDPMSYAPDLQLAYDSLKKTHATVKHIIVPGDGDAEDAAYETLAKKIRAGGVTISTIGTNGLGYADFQTMQNIARWGGGRYYQADNPSSIPSIFLREARTVARSGIIEGKFFPQELSANPMLRDMHGVTDLTGYVATTPKSTGEMVLVSKKLDPVLAAWQFGLGRSVAWTSDASGLWTRDWLQAPGANRFWANLVSWTLPASNGGKLFVNARNSQGEGIISIVTPSSLGANPGVIAHILGPDLHSSTIQLQPSAPGHFQGSFLANAPGTYFVSAEARGTGHAEAGQSGLTVPYSAEYRTTGTNLAFARALARAGGGSIVSRPQSAWLDNLDPVSAGSSLATWLWLLALLLLPIDIGIRRLVVSRQDLQAIRRALAGLGRPSLSPAPAMAPLGAIRSRRTQRSGEAAARTASLQDATQPSASGPHPTQPAARRPAAPSPAIRLSPEALEAAPAKPAKPPESAPTDKSVPPAPDDAAGTTAGRLLASKRRRK